MALTRTNALIIQSKRFRETSLLIVYYTLNFGRIDTIAKGVVGTRKTPVFHLFPSYVELFLYKKENALSLVSSSELLDAFPELHQDLRKLSSALYILELLKETIKESEENSPLFWLLLESFKLLENAKDDASTELILITFQLKFLKLLGYGPFLDNCVVCREKIGKNLPGLKFSAKAGGILCRKCSQEDGESLVINYSLVALMNYLLNLKPSLLARLKVPLNLRKELTKYIEYFRDYHLPLEQKALESLKLMNKNA